MYKATPGAVPGILTHEAVRPRGHHVRANFHTPACIHDRNHACHVVVGVVVGRDGREEMTDLTDAAGSTVSLLAFPFLPFYSFNLIPRLLIAHLFHYSAICASVR